MNPCTLEQLELFLPILNARTNNVNSIKITLAVRPHECHGVVYNNKMAMIADLVSLKKSTNAHGESVTKENVVASVHKNYTLTSINNDIALFEIIYSWLCELQANKLMVPLF